MAVNAARGMSPCARRRGGPGIIAAMRLRIVLLMVLLVCLRGGVAATMAGGMVTAELQRGTAAATAMAMPDCHAVQDIATGDTVAEGCLCLACEACTLNALASPAGAAEPARPEPGVRPTDGVRFASAEPSPRLKPPIG